MTVRATRIPAGVAPSRAAPGRVAISAVPARTQIGAWWVNESAVSAATLPTRVARVSVTRSAGPRAQAPDRDMPRVSATQVTTPKASPSPPPGDAETDASRPGRPARQSGRSAQ